MPQIVLKSSDKNIIIRKTLRAIVSSLVKITWPLIPDSFFLGKINILGIALTRICNSNCIFCPYQFISKDKKIPMSNEVFNAVINNIKKFKIQSVMLPPDVGEPTSAPDFMQKIKAMRIAGVKNIQCTTNGTLLHKIGIKRILEDGPDQINISTAGFSEDMYRRVYRSNLYENMRANILALLEENKNREKPAIINVWLRGDEKKARLLAAMEMKIVMESASEVCIMNEVDPWNGMIHQNMLSGSLKIQEDFPILTHRPCAVLKQINIHPNGDINACSCRNMGQDPDLYLGNIMEVDLMTAYQRIKKIFSQWREGKVPNICKKCYMYSDIADRSLGHLRDLYSNKRTYISNKIKPEF